MIITNLAPVARIDGPAGSTIAHTPYDGGAERLATISFVASGSDTESGGSGTPAYLKYRWTLLSASDANATVSFNPDQQSPTVTLRRTCPCADTPLLGVYRFQLVVTDPNGLASAPVEKSIEIVNAKPTLTPPASRRVVAGASTPLAVSNSAR